MTLEPGAVGELLRHMEWADSLVWRAALELPLEAQRDARVLALLHHAHSVQQAYLQIWRHDAPSLPDVSLFNDLSSLSTWAWPIYADLRRFAADLTRDACTRPVVLPWSAGAVGPAGPGVPPTFSDTVMQVVLHTTYHRAQIASRLREIGCEPPLTDFIAWVWQARPEPVWPAEPSAAV